LLHVDPQDPQDGKSDRDQYDAWRVSQRSGESSRTDVADQHAELMGNHDERSDLVEMVLIITYLSLVASCGPI